jgi:hypothetical protein
LDLKNEKGETEHVHTEKNWRRFGSRFGVLAATSCGEFSHRRKYDPGAANDTEIKIGNIISPTADRLPPMV